MSNIIPFPVWRCRGDTDQGFGVCPKCGGTNGYLNVGRDHWFFCDVHRTKWCPGSNLFSGWREESERDWHRNAKKLTRYREVKALPRVNE